MKKLVFLTLTLLLAFTPYQLDARKHKYPNGDVYDGEWKNKAPNGIGLMLYANGEIYSGSWENGLRSGSGAMSFANGDEYSGDWKEDVFWGEGKMTYANKNVYEGGWEAGKQSGKGIMTYSDGAVYDGEWSMGVYNGIGKMVFANKDIYEGAWQAGKQSGQGAMVYASGSSYEGSWENGFPNGPGKMFYVSGDIHSGLWKNGLRSGEGEFYDKVLDRYIRGTWQDALLSGAGIVRFGSDPDALSLQGDWQEGGLFQTTFSLENKTFAGTILPLTGDGTTGPFLKSGKVVWKEDINAEGTWKDGVTLVSCEHTDLVLGKVHYNVDGLSFDGDVKDGRENNGSLMIAIPGIFSFSGEMKDGQPYGIYVGDMKASPFTGFNLDIWDEVQGADIGRIEGMTALSGVFRKALGAVVEHVEPRYFTMRGMLKDGKPEGEVYMEYSSADSLSLSSLWRDGQILDGRGMLDTVPFTVSAADTGGIQVDLENGERCTMVCTDPFAILPDIRTKIKEQRSLREKLAASMMGGAQ